MASIAASTGGEQADINRGVYVYTCRMCRTILFMESDLSEHSTSMQTFSRRKLLKEGRNNKKNASGGTAVCSSYFLQEPLVWMSEAAGCVEAKIYCPGKKCKARLGVLAWAGSQCSCGSWVTPAIQITKSKVDRKIRFPNDVQDSKNMLKSTLHEVKVVAADFLPEPCSQELPASQEYVDQLLSFGFEEAHARTALKVHSNDVNAALAWLCSSESLDILCAGGQVDRGSS